MKEFKCLNDPNFKLMALICKSAMISVEIERQVEGSKVKKWKEVKPLPGTFLLPSSLQFQKLNLNSHFSKLSNLEKVSSVQHL